jgi:hypothetical protein
MTPSCGLARTFAAMKPILRFLLLFLLVLAGCRSCPIDTCRVRKVHFHNGIKYRGQPLWKKQNPAIGEKINVYRDKSYSPKTDRSKTLK